MKMEDKLSDAIVCEHSQTINILNNIIRLDQYVNIIKINCSYKLLRWSASPTVCFDRHNVVISSISSSHLIKKYSNISLICSNISPTGLIDKLTALVALPKMEKQSEKILINIRDEDLNFYLDLIGRKESMGKYGSNRKIRLFKRYGLQSDYELVLLFNMLHSLPLSMLKIFFNRKQTSSTPISNETVKQSNNFFCRFPACGVIDRGLIL